MTYDCAFQQTTSLTLPARKINKSSIFALRSHARVVATCFISPVSIDFPIVYKTLMYFASAANGSWMIAGITLTRALEMRAPTLQTTAVWWARFYPVILSAKTVKRVCYLSHPFPSPSLGRSLLRSHEGRSNALFPGSSSKNIPRTERSRFRIRRFIDVSSRRYR